MNYLIRKPSQTLTALRSTANIWNPNNLSSFSTSSRSFAVAKSEETKENNEPVKFSTSPASGMTVRQARPSSYNYDDTPWYQRFVVVGSMSVFMLYFFVFREESDIDQKLEKSLFDSVPGLEQTQLVINYKYNLEHNIDNKDIINRMKELGMRPEDIKV